MLEVVTGLCIRYKIQMNTLIPCCDIISLIIKNVHIVIY